MTHEQWNLLLEITGDQPSDVKKPVGFIIDSPWLPGWAGISTLDYYTNEKMWFEANMKAVETFPEIMFLPGFWSEFGMCTEPSAFGAKLIWAEKNLPHADKIIKSIDEAGSLKKPDVRTDGLLPFMLNRLVHYRPEIETAGHVIRFAVARGPMNIASFLMGTTELMMALVMEPEKVHQLLRVITDFLKDWLGLQMETITSIDGVFLLDDIVGFVNDADFRTFAFPYLKEIYDAFNVQVKFFHNDAQGLICAPYLEEMGVNLFNFAFEHSINQMKELTGGRVALLGNLPPRDVLAQGTPGEVTEKTIDMYRAVNDKSRMVWSCGGGMPQDVSTENIRAFLKGIAEA